MNKLEIKELFLTSPSPKELGFVGIKPSLLLDAWQARGLFGYEGLVTTDSQEPIRAVKPGSAGGLMRSSATLEDNLDLYKEDLEAGSFESVVDLLLMTYGSNMRRFELLLQETQQSKVVYGANTPLPKKPGDFAAAVLAGEFREENKKKIDQKGCAQLTGVSQALISNFIRGHLPVKVESFLKIIGGLPVSDELKIAAVDRYINEEAYVSAIGLQPEMIEEFKVKFGQRFVIQAWSSELQRLDRDYLESYGFSWAEEFLLARYLNTEERMDSVKAVMISESDLSVEELIQKAAQEVRAPSLRVLNKYDKVWGKVVLDAWKARGLYRMTESLKSIEGEVINEEGK